MNQPKRGYIVAMEDETKANTDYRRVLFTARYMQLVLMSIAAGDDIGEETHTLDQFIRIEDGEAKVYLNDEEFPLHDDHAVIIPAGTKHNIVNIGTTPLKLYTLYAPPEHKDGIVEKTKADVIEEHFDGMVSPGAE